MPTIDYDPSRAALYSPELRETLFLRDGRYSDAQLAVEAARLAYVRAERSDAERARLEEALGRAGFGAPALFIDGVTGAMGYGTRREADGAALVAFRGTRPDAWGDLLTDVKMLLVGWPEAGGRVHQGFAAAFRGLAAALGRWIGSRSGDRLILTGHSLGGALATLAASVWKPSLLLTLGSPRVGDAEFGRSLAAVRVQRVVNCYDLIPDLPPPLGGYAHVGTFHYLTRRGEQVENPGWGRILYDRLRAELAYPVRYAWRLRKNVLFRRLADHAPINYGRGFF